MKIKNLVKKLNVILFLFVAFASFAQTDSNKLSFLFSSLAENKVTSGNFIQEKSSPKLKRPLKSSGIFIFCEEGVLWKTLKPFPSTMALTKTSMIQTKADGTKVVTDGSSNAVFQSVAATLSSLFAGNQNDLESYFIIEEFTSNSSGWKISLKPKDSTIGQALTKIELSGSIENSKNFYSLDSMKIIQTQGESTSYTLSNKTYRQELSDEEKNLFK